MHIENETEAPTRSVPVSVSKAGGQLWKVSGRQGRERVQTRPGSGTERLPGYRGISIDATRANALSHIPEGRGRNERKE